MNFSVNKFLKDRRLWMISIIIFILLITVFDKNNLIEVWKLNQQLNELENLKDDAFLERYAREHYLMKRQGETIYIIKE